MVTVLASSRRSGDPSSVNGSFRTRPAPSRGLGGFSNVVDDLGRLRRQFGAVLGGSTYTIELSAGRATDAGERQGRRTATGDRGTHVAERATSDHGFQGRQDAAPRDQRSQPRTASIRRTCHCLNPTVGRTALRADAIRGSQPPR